MARKRWYPDALHSGGKRAANPKCGVAAPLEIGNPFVPATFPGTQHAEVGEDLRLPYEVPGAFESFKGSLHHGHRIWLAEVSIYPAHHEMGLTGRFRGVRRLRFFGCLRGPLQRF